MSEKKKKRVQFPRDDYGALIKVTEGSQCDQYLLHRNGLQDCVTCIVGDKEPCTLSKGTAKFILPHTDVQRALVVRVMNSNCEWTVPDSDITINGLFDVFEKEQASADRIWKNNQCQMNKN